jgi:hypothetical protein
MALFAGLFLCLSQVALESRELQSRAGERAPSYLPSREPLGSDCCHCFEIYNDGMRS